MIRTKYPKIRYLDEHPEILDGTVYVFEKLDGANCQIRLDREELVLGARSGSVPTDLKRASWWQDFDRWARTFYAEMQGESGSTLSELVSPEHIFFGEWLSRHTLEYAPEAENQFYLLDVFDTKSKSFLDYEAGVDVATMMACCRFVL
jgi:hypothetical protein